MSSCFGKEGKGITEYKAEAHVGHPSPSDEESHTLPTPTPGGLKKSTCSTE